MAARIMSVNETPFASRQNSQGIHGHIVVWDLPKAKVSITAVAAALVEAGLDEREARSKLPRNVILRAIRALDKSKLVERVLDSETDDAVCYQVSRRYRSGDGMEYQRVAVLSLDKTDGTVTCDDEPEVGAQVQALVNQLIGERNGSDIISIGHRILMKSDIDILPHRKRGGSYYFPVRSFDVLNKVEKFYGQLGVYMSRLPIFAGDPRGDQEVSKLVADGVDGSIDELRQSIQELSIDNRPDTFERRADEIMATRLKVACYAELLDAERQRLLDALAAAEQDLYAAVDRIAGVESDDAAGSDEAAA